MTDTIPVSRELLRQALKAFEVATTPIAADRQEVLAAITALRAALEQPVQEPVAEMSHKYGRPVLLPGAPMLADKQPLFTAPQPVQEKS